MSIGTITLPAQDAERIEEFKRFLESQTPETIKLIAEIFECAKALKKMLDKVPDDKRDGIVDMIVTYLRERDDKKPLDTAKAIANEIENYQ